MAYVRSLAGLVAKRCFSILELWGLWHQTKFVLGVEYCDHAFELWGGGELGYLEGTLRYIHL